MIKVATNLHSLCATQAQLNVPAFKFAAEESEEKGSDKKKAGPDYAQRFRRGAFVGSIPLALAGAALGGSEGRSPGETFGGALLGALLGGGVGGAAGGLGNVADAYLNEDVYSDEKPDYGMRAGRGALVGGGLGALYGLGTGTAISAMSRGRDAAAAPLYLALAGGLGGAGAGALSNALKGYTAEDLYSAKNSK